MHNYINQTKKEKNKFVERTSGAVDVQHGVAGAGSRVPARARHGDGARPAAAAPRRRARGAALARHLHQGVLSRCTLCMHCSACIETTVHA